MNPSTLWPEDWSLLKSQAEGSACLPQAGVHPECAFAPVLKKKAWAPLKGELKYFKTTEYPI
jgi:hypothetical protein